MVLQILGITTSILLRTLKLSHPCIVVEESRSMRRAKSCAQFLLIRDLRNGWVVRKIEHVEGRSGVEA